MEGTLLTLDGMGMSGNGRKGHDIGLHEDAWPRQGTPLRMRLPEQWTETPDIAMHEDTWATQRPPTHPPT